MESFISFSPFPLGFTLIIAFILIVDLPYPTHAWALSHTFADNDLTKGCSFQFEGHAFDLCPLIGQNFVEVDGGKVSGEDGDMQRIYQVNLGAGKSAKSTFSCDEETWVCMIDQAPITAASRISPKGRSIQRIRRRIVPLAGRKRPPSALVDDGVNAQVYLHGHDGDEDATLDLFLIGGQREGAAAQYANIDFQCSYDDSEDHQSIQFRGEYRGVHSFVWISRHACPIIINETRLAIQEVAPKEDTKKEDKQDKEGEELLDPHGTGSRVARRWIATIVLFVGLVVIFAAILMTSPSARYWTQEHLHRASCVLLPLLHRAEGTLKPLQKPLKSMLPKKGRTFRQGDSRLVQWAQEDMTLDDMDEMVNGEGDDDRWDVEQLDEYIPLKMSPRWNQGKGSVQSYGTAEPIAESSVELARGKRDGYWFSKFLRRS